MSLKTSCQKYVLDFRFDAGTSRGVLKEKATYFIKVWHEKEEGVYGLGECGPLKHLSIDDREDLEQQLRIVLDRLEKNPMPAGAEGIYDMADALAGASFPAVRFGIETALLDLMNGGRRVIFESDFTRSALSIPINGLIWMGPVGGMLKQVSEKLAAGFDCIKMKIGSLDFQKECDMLEHFRREYSQQDVMLRVDANGAFKAADALHKLELLSRYNIHSIEQPIAAGHRDEMAALCRESPVGIALDEELIGIYSREDKERLLNHIRPQYIILKPTLVGGIRSCLEWIEIAASMEIGWWLTSALESNIGLNAICQFAIHAGAKGHQGLGTGQLYHNNVPSPLQVSDGHIHYDRGLSWDLSAVGL